MTIDCHPALVVILAVIWAATHVITRIVTNLQPDDDYPSED